MSTTALSIPLFLFPRRPLCQRAPPCCERLAVGSRQSHDMMAAKPRPLSAIPLFIFSLLVSMWAPEKANVFLLNHRARFNSQSGSPDSASPSLPAFGLHSCLVLPTLAHQGNRLPLPSVFIHRRHEIQKDDEYCCRHLLLLFPF